MARRRARRTIDLDTLLQAAPILRSQHDIWTANGLAVTRAQLWRSKDGSYTVRLVWRGGGAVGLSAECTARGLVL